MRINNEVKFSESIACNINILGMHQLPSYSLNLAGQNKENSKKKIYGWEWGEINDKHK